MSVQNKMAPVLSILRMLENLIPGSLGEWRSK